jgi:hypothetical protein
MSDSDVLVQPPSQVRFDAGSHARAKIGYVLLATEQTVQDDVLRLRPPGVGIHFISTRSTGAKWIICNRRGSK